MRALLIAAGIMIATPALACPMADAAAFKEAAAQVETAEGTKVALAVEGMHCSSCSAKVMKALQKAKGVHAAAVDYQSGKANIAFDAAKTDAATLMQVIEKTGFKASETTES